MTAIGHRLIRLDSCASTNDVAAAMASDSAEPAAHGTVVVADSQDAGRGRRGRHWHSPPGLNLYISCILRPRLPAHRVPPLTLCAGLAVAEAVNSLGVKPSIKWPNDVLVGGRKLAGILTETTSRGHEVDSVITGIGVNVNDRSLPADLSATSLATELHRTVDRDALLADLCARFDGWYRRFLSGGSADIAPALWRWSALREERVQALVDGRRTTGIIVGLDDDGALIIEDDGGTRHRVISGEITTAEPRAKL